jgi:hypothetical protein
VSYSGSPSFFYDLETTYLTCPKETSFTLIRTLTYDGKVSEKEKKELVSELLSLIRAEDAARTTT